MKAVETKFLKFLQGQRQFVSPIYQRTYSWTVKECEQLWNDIVRAASDAGGPVPPLLGSVFHIEGAL